MTRMIRTVIIVIILTIITIIAFKIFKVQNYILKQIYKTEYSEYVEKYAKEYSIDPLLIYSIIKAESNFKPDVKSSSNAIGLMQIMEGTAEDLLMELNIEYSDVEQLYDPEINIQIGVAYYSALLKKYDENMMLALIAYNAGLGNVDKWIEEGTIKEDGSDIENVPFKETNNYVRKILRDYEIYKDIYSN